MRGKTPSLEKRHCRVDTIEAKEIKGQKEWPAYQWRPWAMAANSQGHLDVQCVESLMQEKKIQASEVLHFHFVQHWQQIEREDITSNSSKIIADWTQ